MLSLNLSSSLTGNYNSSRGLVAGTGLIGDTSNLSLADGTAAGQADGLFTFTDGIAAGETQSFGLFSGLIDLYGATLEFSAVKVLWIEADVNNVGPLIIGGGTWDGPFGVAANTLQLRPGDKQRWETEGANGWPVDPDADVLQIFSATDGNFSLSIAGVSTAVYPPVCVARPRMLSIPTAGVELDYFDGDWSGSPTFTYQHKRGGVAIVGATNASYVPVQADVGHALSRSTVATNSAGSVPANSNAVTCVGGAVENDLDLTTGNAGLSAVL